MNKVAAYLRVSTKEQDVRLQSEVCRMWLKSQGIEGATWFIDKASGKNLDRPRLRALQAAVIKGSIDTVVMYALDRFARTMVDGLVELEKWKKAGVRIVFVKEQMEINGGNPLGDLFIKCMTAMALAFAEAERERFSHRRRDGIATARKMQIRAHTLHEQGATPEQIARHLNRPMCTIKRMLSTRKGGLYWGGPHAKGRRKASPEKAWEMRYKMFLPQAKIAAALGINLRSVFNYQRQWEDHLESERQMAEEARERRIAEQDTETAGRSVA